AIRAAEKAMRLDPSRQDFYVYFLAVPYVLMGRYADAIPLLKRNLSTYNQPWGHAYLVMAYAELGRDREAQAEAVELKRMNPDLIGHAPLGNLPAFKRLFDDLRKEGLH